MTNKQEHEIQIRAEELIKQYGKRAAKIAKEKIDNLPKNVDLRQKDFAFMVLTRVEKLLEERSE